MSVSLSFALVHHYDTRAAGISLPVSVRSGPLSIELQAKVDTGSTFCVFERRHGERLGLDIESGTPERIGSVMGSFTAYGHEVTLAVLGIETTATVYFAAQEHFPRNVLGRAGWLDRVRLGLIDYDGRLYLSHYEDPD
jgi:hypothetical protein